MSRQVEHIRAFANEILREDEAPPLDGRGYARDLLFLADMIEELQDQRIKLAKLQEEQSKLIKHLNEENSRLHRKLMTVRREYRWLSDVFGNPPKANGQQKPNGRRKRKAEPLISIRRMIQKIKSELKQL